MIRLSRTLFVVLMIGLTLIAVPYAAAESLTMEGFITDISVAPNVVVLNGEDSVYGVKLDYLCNKYNICLKEDDFVSFQGYEYYCRQEGIYKFRATSITVDDATVEFR